MDANVFLNDAEVKAALTTDEFVSCCDRALRLYGGGRIENPARQADVTREGSEDVFRLDMPAEWVGHYRGRKWIEERSDVGSGRLGERTARIEVEDLREGRTAAVDAELITNQRTGAAAVLGASYLGPKEISSVGLVGTGRIAESIVSCLAVRIPGAIVRVTSRSEQRREAFAERVAEATGLRVTAVASVREALVEADAVFAATASGSPVLSEDDLKAAAHLSVVGGDPRTKQVSQGLLTTRPIVADHREQARVSGDFVEEGRASLVSDDSPTLGDAALGRLEHRRGEGAIAYLTGLAAQDLVTAVEALNRTLWS